MDLFISVHKHLFLLLKSIRSFAWKLETDRNHFASIVIFWWGVEISWHDESFCELINKYTGANLRLNVYVKFGFDFLNEYAVLFLAAQHDPM